jgi:hypothetical protein
MNETPLLDQIRVYSEALVEDLPSPATNVMNAPVPLAPLPAQRDLRWLVAMAAVALIVIVVGAAAWLSPFSGTAVPPAGEPAETTIPVETTAPEAEGVTETTVSPAEAPPAQQLLSSETGVWYPVTGALEAADSEGFDDILFDVADTPYGIIGTSGQGLWVSQDGIVWEAYARDSIQFVGGVSFARVAASDLGVLVVEPAGGSQAWHSADGIEWVEVQIPGFPQGVSARIAATDEAFVVAADGRIWRSTNGIEWVETVVDADVFNSGIASIRTLEATPFGFVAGGGERSFPDGSFTPNRGRNAIWHSDDGLSWARATDLPGEPRPMDESVYDLAGSELGVVAVTSSGAIWFSPDAVDWTEVLTARRNVRWVDSAVGASSTGFVVASGYSGRSGMEAQVLTSVDGTTWVIAGYVTPEGEYPATQYPGTDESGEIMREAIPLGNGFLIVGESGGPTSPVRIYKP